jgi:hypothetical protein
MNTGITDFRIHDVLNSLHSKCRIDAAKGVVSIMGCSPKEPD